MTVFIAWMARPFVQFGVIAIGALALWTGFALHEQSKGAQKQIIKTEKANAAVVNRADRVRAKSRDPRVRGNPDPHYID